MRVFLFALFLFATLTCAAGLAPKAARGQTTDRATVTLLVDPLASSLQFKAVLRSPLGGDADSTLSAVRGSVTAEVTPSSLPFAEMQLTALTLSLSDEVSLRFDLGSLLKVDAKAAPDSIRIVLTDAGSSTSLNDDYFLQSGNTIGLRGSVQLDGSGLLSGVVPKDPQRIDVDAEAELSGTLGYQNGRVRLTLPVAFSGTADLGAVPGGNILVDATLTGMIVAIAPEGTSPEAAPVLPEAFSLAQNYPNPFNPATTISYTLAAPAHVRLGVYDVLGRRIALLVDGPRPAGSQTVPFDASGLPGGVYLYRLEAGAYVATRRLVLLP